MKANTGDPLVSAQPDHERRADKGIGEMQAFGSVIRTSIGLDENVRAASVKGLNHLLADSITLRDMYKKSHWQVSGQTFYQLHVLFDKHHAEQSELVDSLAERVQLLGGVAIAMGRDVAAETNIPTPPKGREDVTTQIHGLLAGHELLLKEARRAAREAAERGDEGTNDLLVSGVVRTNELQAWFVSEHLSNHRVAD
jgi:starvation-inducible DNA-binding protein